MRKILTTILLSAVIASTTNAQTVGDALKFSDNNYYGTARSIAMGNAFTALGGDLGSLGINPAGSAVNNFSQITITPNISIVATSANYMGEPSVSDNYGSAVTNSRTRFTIPNVGATIIFKTGSRRGLKNVTLGFVANATANFADNMAAYGKNKETSFAGSLAANAGGYSSSMLTGENAYWSNGPSWLSIIGWQSGMISNYGDGDKNYIGATEKLYDNNVIMVPDNLDQRYGRIAKGNKYDMVFNVGFNFSDKFYLGANLGVISMDYSMNQYFKEGAINPSSFEVKFADENDDVVTTYFDNLRYRYHYSASGTGFYGKFGFIAVPIEWLRIGGAIQTPTAFLITERWQMAGDTHYTDSQFDASATSPKSEYSYKLVSPFRANIGAAITFGRYGLISADYEFCNYPKMKFRETETNDMSALENVNNDIKNYTGGSHSLRLGAELKITPAFAIRAGYGVVTNGERAYKENGDKYTPKANRHIFSAGLGYSSDGSFFCDLAVRGTKYPYEYIYPYSDYIFDNKENITSATPEIRNKTTLIDVVATIGFRF